LLFSSFPGGCLLFGGLQGSPFFSFCLGLGNPLRSLTGKPF